MRVRPVVEWFERDEIQVQVDAAKLVENVVSGNEMKQALVNEVIKPMRNTQRGKLKEDNSERRPLVVFIGF